METVITPKHFKLNIDQYYKMGEIGILTDHDHVELIEGELICQGETRKITVDEYHKMIEAEILCERDPVELINGELLQTILPIGPRHPATRSILMTLFFRLSNEQVNVWLHGPVALAPWSEPEPDIALLRRRKDYYVRALPRPEDVLLIIEVADTSLQFDREIKLPLYATQRIPEYWIVDLNARQVEVYRRPQGNNYTDVAIAKRNEIIRPTLLTDVAIDLKAVFLEV